MPEPVETFRRRERGVVSGEGEGGKSHLGGFQGSQGEGQRCEGSPG